MSGNFDTTPKMNRGDDSDSEVVSQYTHRMVQGKAGPSDYKSRPRDAERLSGGDYQTGRCDSRSERRRSRSRSESRDRRYRSGRDRETDRHKYRAKEKSRAIDVSKGRSRSRSRERLDRREERHRHSRRYRHTDHSNSEHDSDSGSVGSHRKRKRYKRKRHERTSETSLKCSSQRISWGKYGIIDETDIDKKRSEFRSWLVEERSLNLDRLDSKKKKKEFLVFVEDYNTGTLAHEKYYDMEKYRFKMELVKSGHTLPIEQGTYDPTADLRAHDSRVKAEKRNRRVLSREEVEELRRVEKERVEIGRMRLLGIAVPHEMGVRADYVKVDEINFD